MRKYTITAIGVKEQIWRNAEISFDVLNGETLESTAKKFSLTRERVRQIVRKRCRFAYKKINPQGDFWILSLNDLRNMKHELQKEIRESAVEHYA